MAAAGTAWFSAAGSLVLIVAVTYWQLGPVPAEAAVQGQAMGLSCC